MKCVPHTIRISERATRVSIRIHKSKNRVEVVVPKKWQKKYSARVVENILEKKRLWIEKHLEKNNVKQYDEKKHIGPQTPRAARAHYEQHKGSAHALVLMRVEHFNTYYNFSYNAVRIKNTTSRWGSCSENKNLNFSYKILFLPEHLRDYIIVHELCHLEHLNHSPAFWLRVAELFPRYVEIRKELRQWQL